ncbi:MBL fold metallo-hydrolase [Chloroflexota bacterium]
MKVKWFGQAAFLLVSEKGLRVITDPYDPSIGYEEIASVADVTTVSHDHRDHNFIAGVKGKPKVVKGAGLQEANGIQFKGVATFHDKIKGDERGRNTVFCFSLDDVRICHLGDLGHLLNDEQIAEIGQVNLLLVPVGGRSTIDAVEATELTAKLRPSVVVPMHFKTEKAGLRFAEVDVFLAGKTNIIRLSSSEFDMKKEDLSTATQIIVLEHAR